MIQKLQRAKNVLCGGCIMAVIYAPHSDYYINMIWWTMDTIHGLPLYSAPWTFYQHSLYELWMLYNVFQLSFKLLPAACFMYTYSRTMNSSHVYMIIPRSNFIGQWMRIGGTFFSVKHWTLFIWHVIIYCHFHGCNWIYLMTENCILAQVVICTLLSLDVWFLNPRLAHVGFVVDRVGWEQIFLQVL